MMRRLQLFYAASLLCAASTSSLAAQANTAQANPAQADCLNAQTQMAMDQCAGRNLKAADQKLNETYRALMAKVSKNGAEQLKKSQRAWVAWRDAQCEFDTMGSRGGSIHSMVYTLCVQTLTQAQQKHLDSQLHCEEGDTACGGQ
jgi:uncharacterized protein YecT (DUF1311 family)